MLQKQSRIIFFPITILPIYFNYTFREEKGSLLDLRIKQSHLAYRNCKKLFLQYNNFLGISKNFCRKSTNINFHYINKSTKTEKLKKSDHTREEVHSDSCNFSFGGREITPESTTQEVLLNPDQHL